MQIGQLVRKLEKQKEKEATARAERIETEEAIAAVLDCEISCSKTHEIGKYRVTIKRPVNRRLNPDKWESIKEKVPEDLRPVRYKAELDERGVKWLIENEPKLWAIVSRAVETRPAKTAITLKKEE